jgi:hypothetical protein
MVQVVALQARLVGGGEHVACDVVPSACDRGLCQRGDRHPVTGAELLGDRHEARQATGCDVQVGDVLKRLVGLLAQTTGT